MKLWQGALAFPLGAVAASLGYDLYRRLVEP